MTMQRIKFRKEFDMALAAMDNEFTSNDFGIELRKLGVPKSITANGSITNFLSGLVEKVAGKRRWRKFNRTSKSTEYSMTIQEMIDALYANGYKVFEADIVWREVPR